MNKLILLVSIAVTFVLAAPTWACEAAGPSTHVGKVLKIDEGKNTFTILDAQTVSPITFEASDEILSKVGDATGTAFVDYSVDGLVLTATDVTFR